MIHFLTNEHVPERLQAAIENLKQDQKKKNRISNQDRTLVFLGVFFLSTLICLAALLVYSIITLF